MKKITTPGINQLPTLVTLSVHSHMYPNKPLRYFAVCVHAESSPANHEIIISSSFRPSSSRAITKTSHQPLSVQTMPSHAVREFYQTIKHPIQRIKNLIIVLSEHIVRTRRNGTRACAGRTSKMRNRSHEAVISDGAGRALSGRVWIRRVAEGSWDSISSCSVHENMWMRVIPTYIPSYRGLWPGTPRANATLSRRPSSWTFGIGP